jgi:hypothetical protein
MNDDEWDVVIYALNELRTKLIGEGSDCIDIVNDVLLKVIRSPKKKVKER